MTKVFASSAALLAAGWLCALPARAQVDELQEGEMAVYFGPVLGSGRPQTPADAAQAGRYSPGFGTHVVVGASTSVVWGKWTAAGLDSSFTPMGSETLRPVAPVADIRSSHLYNFSLNFRIGPRAKRGRFAPYGIAGGGLLYATYQALDNRLAGIEYKARSSTNFVFNTGGGVSYMLGDNWGIRPEARVCISTRTFVQITIGFFGTVSNEDWFRRSIVRKLGL